MDAALQYHGEAVRLPTHVLSDRFPWRESVSPPAATADTASGLTAVCDGAAKNCCLVRTSQRHCRLGKFVQRSDCTEQARQDPTESVFYNLCSIACISSTAANVIVAVASSNCSLRLSKVNKNIYSEKNGDVWSKVRNERMPLQITVATPSRYKA